MKSSKTPRWTFLTNHAMVLITVYHDPSLTVRGIAEQVGITERATHRILSALVEAGYIARHRIGRKNHYFVSSDRPFRHPAMAHHEIGLLLKVVAS